MGFGGSGGGTGSIQTSSDVALSGLSDNDVLTYNASDTKWENKPATGGGAPTLANLPTGSTITVAKSGGTWSARPTSRNDIVVQWKGPDPSPSIVASGTGGMLDNVDIRFVTPS